MSEKWGSEIALHSVMDSEETPDTEYQYGPKHRRIFTLFSLRPEAGYMKN